nr:hypothetical protein [Tanacetum cinerariifolium]
MNTRSRSSTSRNEEIYGNSTNTYGTSTRGDSDDVPRSLNIEHKNEKAHTSISTFSKEVTKVLSCTYDNSPDEFAIKQMLTKPKKSGRVAKRAIKLGEHDIVFQERGDKTPKDFLIEVPPKDNEKKAKEKADTKSTKTKLSCLWKLFTDRATSFDGSDARLMLIDPEGKEYTYALPSDSKQQTMKQNTKHYWLGTYAAKQRTIKEYLQKTKEALKGFESYTIEHIRRNQNKKDDALSKLASMNFEHLTKEMMVEVLPNVSGLLPNDPKESRKIKVKAPQYKLIRGNIYRRSFYTSWLRYVALPQTDDIVKEVHEGSCGFNAKPRSMVVRTTKQGNYWPSMHRDATKELQDCEKCKEQFAIGKVAESSAITAKNGWPFNLDGDGERGFDCVTFALVSSKAHREWCKASRGGFPYWRRSHSGFEGEAFEPERRDTIAMQRCGLSAKELNEFLSFYPIPSQYDVILPTSTQTIFDAPPGYVSLYTHSFSLANLRLPLTDFFCEVITRIEGWHERFFFVQDSIISSKYSQLLLDENRLNSKSFKDKLPPNIDENLYFQCLGRYPTSVRVFNDPILFLAGLKPSWEFGQQRPAIIVGDKGILSTEDDDDLAFSHKEPYPGFGTGSPSASVNTELLKDVEEPEVQPAKMLSAGSGL